MESPIARRELLRAGSALGLLALVGCADGSSIAAKKDPPSPAWPMTSPPGIAPASGDPAELILDTRVAVIDDVLPRSRWTTKELARPEVVPLMNGVTMVTVSHDGRNAFTGTTEVDTIERLGQIKAAHIQRVSKNGRPWADIGHHFIIDRAGRAWEGRPLKYQGAHVQDHNEHNVGVLCLGNFTMQYPTTAMTDRLDRLLLQIAAAYRLRIDAIRTHLELKPTENPGRNMQAYMNKTRSMGGALQRMMAERELE
jgi:hypothetical protein